MSGRRVWKPTHHRGDFWRRVSIYAVWFLGEVIFTLLLNQFLQALNVRLSGWNILPALLSYSEIPTFYVLHYARSRAFIRRIPPLAASTDWWNIILEGLFGQANRVRVASGRFSKIVMMPALFLFEEVFWQVTLLVLINTSIIQNSLLISALVILSLQILGVYLTIRIVQETQYGRRLGI